MRKNYILLIAAVSFFMLNAKAQDPQFTQFYANPLYLNPALAGSSICPRVCINYRNEWPGIAGTYVTTSVSFDKYVYGIKSGIGILAVSDRAGQGTIITNNFSGIYSKQFSITRNFSINAGFQAAYAEKSIDWSKLTFGDQIDDHRGFVKNSDETPGRSKRSYADFSAGAIGFGKRFFAGAAVHHLAQPDESFLPGGASRLPLKITAHAGALIPIGLKESGISVSPNVLYQKQQNFQQLDLGVYFTKNAFVGGIWYRSNDSFILLLGIQKGIIKIGYSYDVTVSRLTNASAGSHELSIGFQFNCKKPKPKYRPGVCPSF